MPLNLISEPVLNAIQSRLADPSIGFNPTLAAFASQLGLPTFVQLNFTPQSQNFYRAQLDTSLMESSGILTYPFACLYVKESAQQNIQKFNEFSGQVQVVLEINLSFTSIRGTQNSEAYCNCVEATVMHVINTVNAQNWSPLVYNGQARCRRGPLSFAATNWKQVCGFSFIFEVHNSGF